MKRGKNLGKQIKRNKKEKEKEKKLDLPLLGMIMTDM